VQCHWYGVMHYKLEIGKRNTLPQKTTEHCTYCFVQVNDATPVRHFCVELLKTAQRGNLAIFVTPALKKRKSWPLSELRTAPIYPTNYIPLFDHQPKRNKSNIILCIVENVNGIFRI